MQSQVAATAARAALISRKEFLELLNVSGSTFDRMKSLGRLPRHVTLGNVHRWNKDEVLAWIESGCVPMPEWKARRAAKK
jgi:predicted DNA-binding transcriptional regulator AlpA